MIRGLQKPRLQRTVLLVGTMFLLLALLVPHALGHHHGVTLAFILLSPVFLFGTIEAQSTSWSATSADKNVPCPSPCRPSLFQRPPPSLSA
jgi:hypothetical protein